MLPSIKKNPARCARRKELACSGNFSSTPACVSPRDAREKNPLYMPNPPRGHFRLNRAKNSTSDPVDPGLTHRTGHHFRLTDPVLARSHPSQHPRTLSAAQNCDPPPFTHLATALHTPHPCNAHNSLQRRRNDIVLRTKNVQPNLLYTMDT